MGAVCPSWLSFILYNPVRKAFTDRQRVLEESGITPDSVVLEIGAGNGFFTEMLGRQARKVFAVELQEGMIRKLKRRTEALGNKVEIIQGDIATLDIGEEFADVCLLYYCFHEVSNKADAAIHINSAVKKGGILSIYEPAFEVGNSDMQKTIGLFERNGFSTESSRDGALTRFARLRKTA